MDPELFLGLRKYINECLMKGFKGSLFENGKIPSFKVEPYHHLNGNYFTCRFEPKFQVAFGMFLDLSVHYLDEEHRKRDSFVLIKDSYYNSHACDFPKGVPLIPSVWIFRESVLLGTSDDENVHKLIREIRRTISLFDDVVTVFEVMGYRPERDM